MGNHTRLHFHYTSAFFLFLPWRLVSRLIVSLHSPPRYTVYSLCIIHTLYTHNNLHPYQSRHVDTHPPLRSYAKIWRWAERVCLNNFSSWREVRELFCSSLVWQYKWSRWILDRVSAHLIGHCKIRYEDTQQNSWLIAQRLNVTQILLILYIFEYLATKFIQNKYLNYFRYIFHGNRLLVKVIFFLFWVFAVAFCIGRSTVCVNKFLEEVFMLYKDFTKILQYWYFLAAGQCPPFWLIWWMMIKVSLLW